MLIFVFLKYQGKLLPLRFQIVSLHGGNSGDKQVRKKIKVFLAFLFSSSLHHHHYRHHPMPYRTNTNTPYRPSSSSSGLLQATPVHRWECSAVREACMFSLNCGMRLWQMPFIFVVFVLTDTSVVDCWCIGARGDWWLNDDADGCFGRLASIILYLEILKHVPLCLLMSRANNYIRNWDEDVVERRLKYCSNCGT